MLRKKVTYEQIRRIDPSRFHDLESTMKMLYDHGPECQAMAFETEQDWVNYPQSISSTPVLKEASSKRKTPVKPPTNPKLKPNILASAANLKKSPIPSQKLTRHFGSERFEGDYPSAGPHSFMPHDTPVF